MFVSIWALLVFMSIVVSAAAFFWGLYAGQFSNADRARYLPFAGEKDGPATSVGVKMKLPLEVYVLGGIVLFSLLILGAPVVMTLYHILVG